MDRFITSTKRKYRERLLQREEQWPLVLVEKLVNLQLVEADKKKGFRAGLPQHGALNDKVKRTPILHSDLFKVEEGKKLVKKLVVEGNAGMGKTTLCTMLTESGLVERSSHNSIAFSCFLSERGQYQQPLLSLSCSNYFIQVRRFAHLS